MIKYICTQCDYVGERKLVKPGSAKLEFILWITIFVLATPYTLWRHLFGRKRFVCPQCGGKSMIIEKKFTGMAGAMDDKPLTQAELDLIPNRWKQDVSNYIQKQQRKENSRQIEVKDVKNTGKNEDEW